MGQLSNFFLVLGLTGSLFAAVMVYLITYNEYVHHYATKQQPIKIAFAAAITAFVFFMLMITGVGYFLTHNLKV